MYGIWMAMTNLNRSVESRKVIVERFFGCLCYRVVKIQSYSAIFLQIIWDPWVEFHEKLWVIEVREMFILLLPNVFYAETTPIRCLGLKLFSMANQLVIKV